MTTESRMLHGRRVTANQLRRTAGAPGVAEFIPAHPMDLSDWEELRVWIRGRAATGTVAQPFYLALSYEDAHDAPTDQHRWFLPVNDSAGWEQRVIGIGADRRNSIVRFRLESIGETPFSVELSRLVAVREEMLEDIERALLDALSGVRLPDLTRIPLRASITPGTHTALLPHTPGLCPGFLVLLQGRKQGDEEHQVTAVTHDERSDRTTLTFDASEPVRGAFTADSSFASAVVPVVGEVAPGLGYTATPRIAVSHTNAREDPQRSQYTSQRDSFRQRGALTVCSVRPPARAYLADYQVIVVAVRPSHKLSVRNEVLARLSADRPLWINESPAPVRVLEPPLEVRDVADAAQVHIRVGSRIQTGPREEYGWVRHADVQADRPDEAPGTAQPVRRP
ncbi:hypothetical protein ACWEF9_09410 [Streptomyces sp. NPDC004980]